MNDTRIFLLKEKDNDTIIKIILIDAIIMILSIIFIFYNEAFLRSREASIFFIKHKDELSELIIASILIITPLFIILRINKDHPSYDNQEDQIKASYKYKMLLLTIAFLNVPLLTFLFYVFFGSTLLGLQEHDYFIYIISTIAILCFAILICMDVIFTKTKELLKTSKH